MDTALWIYVLLWVVIGGLVGHAIGRMKGRPEAGGLWGALFAVIGWLVIAAGPNHRPKCPECGGIIEQDVRRCKNCGSELSRSGPPESADDKTAIPIALGRIESRIAALPSDVSVSAIRIADSLERIESRLSEIAAFPSDVSVSLDQVSVSLAEDEAKNIEEIADSLEQICRAGSQLKPVVVEIRDPKGTFSPEGPTDGEVQRVDVRVTTSEPEPDKQTT